MMLETTDRLTQDDIENVFISRNLLTRFIPRIYLYLCFAVYGGYHYTNLLSNCNNYEWIFGQGR